ncbi:MAG: endonuclease IV [Candidatus Bathyarchaeota archaeon BA1]|nr:MAG: endonuclease IV [Candidatus Bathyarchaeota archaeon BA1]
MADRPRFGPAGVPTAFKALKRSVVEFPKYLHDEGLDAFEYQATRWGPKPQMKMEDAEALGINAKKYDVWLTLHGSYFINLCGDRETIEGSKKRLIACATAADWMGAHVVVFHPGFYGKRTPKEALELCVNAMGEVVESLHSLGIGEVRLGPETTGKLSQLGSLDEILGLCERVELTDPIIDWSHIHAREGGRLRTIGDYQKVMDAIEKRLGTDMLRNLHCHYTPVEFAEKGERRHHTMDEAGFGPEFRFLANLIVEMDLKPVIISESPILDIDAQKMRDILLRELGERSKR